MSISPSSSTSPTASTPADLQEADAFSDDSGVDVKPQVAADLRDVGRRNKRKSSEPKKRKDVLLMKRFRWDSEEEEEEDSEASERERPSSGDSGCQLECPRDQKKKPKQWRKPVHKEGEPPLRQSVICKNEATDLHREQHSAPEQTANPGPSGSYDESQDTPRTRNYKNMSRQRRIEANARERTRVHTISAAFESLRRAVPAYAHNQKLSKLAILRIASAYIVALACLNGQEQQTPSMADCVDKCTRTIQAEGRSRRRTSKD